jgi:drug/metabolite transporter (DMT)-like permease
MFAVASAIAFGTVSIMAKYAYEAGADPLPVLAVRFTIAAAVIAVFLRGRGIPITMKRRSLTPLLLLGAFGYGIEASLFFIALEHTTAAVVGLVFYSYPLWTTLVAIALRIERIRLALFIALGLSSCGVALIFSLPRGDMTGPLLALGAALVVSVYFVWTQILVKGVDPSVAALWTLVGAAISLAVATLVTRQAFPIDALGVVAALGATTSVAFLLMYAAIARVGSSRFAVAATFEPVTTIILAALLLDEVVTWRIGLGAALVISALPILARTARSETPIPAADSL